MDDDALLVIFAGEQPSLDNKLAVEPLNAPRNIGFVKVPKNMEDKSVLSEGPTETGGFYTFTGAWSPTENKGINWLTDFTSLDENAGRIKVTKLSNGEILVLFEIWTETEFVSTNVMTLDHDGKITRGPRVVTSKWPLRLPFADEIESTSSNTAVFYAGAPGKVMRYEISLSSDPGSGVSEIVAQEPMTTTAVPARVAMEDLGSVQYVTTAPPTFSYSASACYFLFGRLSSMFQYINVVDY